jgi:hypothetical protein
MSNDDGVAVGDQTQAVHLSSGDVVLDKQDLDVILHSSLLRGR